jgi:phage terminase large subunit-like protein
VVRGQRGRQAWPAREPVPAKQRDGKIDAAVALLMAIGRVQASESDGVEDITAFLLNPVMG